MNGDGTGRGRRGLSVSSVSSVSSVAPGAEGPGTYILEWNHDPGNWNQEPGEPSLWSFC